jgi:hypothetical protein
VLCHLKERRKKFRIYRCHPVQEPKSNSIFNLWVDEIVSHLPKNAYEISLDSYLCNDIYSLFTETIRCNSFRSVFHRSQRSHVISFLGVRVGKVGGRGEGGAKIDHNSIIEAAPKKVGKEDLGFLIHNRAFFRS